MHRLRRLALLPIGVITAGALTGCGDGGVDPLDVLADFRPSDVRSAYQQDLTPLSSGQRAQTVLDDALTDISQMTGVELERPVSPVRRLLATHLPTPSLLVGALVDFGSAAGKTFVYDPATEAWEADPDATGAPAAGVRITWYEIDSFGTIVEPLQVRGYIDVEDQDRTDTEQVGLRIVSTEDGGEVVVSDLTEAYAPSAGGDTWEESFSAVGFASDGVDTLAFDIQGDGAGAEGVDEFAFLMEFTGTRGHYTYSLQESLDTGTQDYAQELTVTADLDGDVTELRLEGMGNVDATTSDGTGQIRYRGVHIVDITMVDGELTFKKTSGESFDTTEADRLESLTSFLMLSGIIVLSMLPLILF